MNLGELIGISRTLLRDNRTPFLWSDEVLTEFVNDAVDEACIRARLLESTVVVPVTAGVDSYTLSYEIQRLSNVIFIDQSATETTAGNFKVGNWYTIATPGTTDFTLVGAPNSLAGTPFVTTGVGTGDGTAKLGLPSPLTFISQPELQNYKLHNVSGYDYASATGVQPRPYFISHGDSLNDVSIYPTPNATGSLIITLRRLPLSTERLTDISDVPVIPETFHRGLVDWVLAQAYAVDLSDTRSDRQSERYEAKFEARFGRRPTARGETAGRRYGVGSDVYPQRFGG